MKKGYMLLEVLAWLSVIAVVVLIIATNLFGTFKQYYDLLMRTGVHNEFALINKSILTDLQTGNGDFAITDYGFTINEVMYYTNGKDIARVNKTGKYKLGSGKMEVSTEVINDETYLVIDYLKKGISYHRIYKVGRNGGGL